jgi:uncharacterized protein YprB with RNaseH-like and TPR domain
MGRVYPRIEETVHGSVIEGCYRILTEVDSLDIPPARQVKQLFQKWHSGEYNNSNYYLMPDKTQFVDIETRGVSTTNQTWLIGTAHMNKHGLVIEQLLARNPLEEKQILKAFHNLTLERPDWVSFNGETFDSSRLFARAQAHQIGYNESRAHVDFYQAFNRLARRKGLAKATLREFERVLFPTFKRQNHIEGRDIPQAVQHYFEGGDPHPVKNAIDHNTYDLVTLAAVYLLALQMRS